MHTLDKHASKGDVEIKDVLACFTTDVIGKDFEQFRVIVLFVYFISCFHQQHTFVYFMELISKTYLK
jgi:hypothetical protein